MHLGLVLILAAGAIAAPLPQGQGGMFIVYV
jgi:hypothetical protein